MRAAVSRPALLCLLLPLAAVATGCKSAWERHDEVHYVAIKTPSPETAQAYAKLLEEIIQNAEKANTRPPAGVCAEYAYYQAKLGRLDIGGPYLEKEAQYYPEARTFLTAFRRFLGGVTPFSSTPAQQGPSQ